MILGSGGVKMSKSLGNVVNPDDIIKEYGADVLRVYEMFIGPFDQSVAWEPQAIVGIKRFFDRLLKLSEKISDNAKTLPVLHQTIKKVTDNIEQMAFNTSVSQMMICVNEYEKQGSISKHDFSLFLKIIAPFAPYITEAFWQDLGYVTSIHKEAWPQADEKLAEEEEVTYAIQITGKLRGTIVLPKDLTENQVMEQLKNHEIYIKYIGSENPKKVIFVPNRLVNIVI